MLQEAPENELGNALFVPVTRCQSLFMMEIAEEMKKNELIKEAFYGCVSVKGYLPIRKDNHSFFIPKKLQRQSTTKVAITRTDRRELVYYEDKVNKIRKNLGGDYLNNHLLREEVDRYLLFWDQFLRNNRIYTVVIWNGYLLPQSTLAFCAKKLKLKIIYCENSLVPGEVVFDEKGINAKSSFSLASLKNDRKGNLKEFQEIDINNNKNSFVFLLYYLLNYYIFKLKYRRLLRYEYTQSGMNWLTNKISIIKEKKTMKPADYIFFPIQVATDSQVLINSFYTQDKILKHLVQTVEAINKLYNLNFYIIAKNHPRQEKNYFKRLKKEIPSDRMIWKVHGHVDDLIQDSRVVITINSSVGYTALKMNKDVIVLGEAIYSGNGLARKIKLSSLEETLLRILVYNEQICDKDKINSLLYSYKNFVVNSQKLLRGREKNIEN